MGIAYPNTQQLAKCVYTSYQPSAIGHQLSAVLVCRSVGSVSLKPLRECRQLQLYYLFLHCKSIRGVRTPHACYSTPPHTKTEWLCPKPLLRILHPFPSCLSLGNKSGGYLNFRLQFFTFFLSLINFI